jgi:FtsP/CotA-like multicopper oxidase with cupredoxin domain
VLAPAPTPRAALASRSARRRRLLAGAVALVVAVVAPACGDADRASTGDTPGFDGNGRTIDTRPFDLPELGGDGATTLPDEFFENPALTTTTAPTTTAPTTTSTTTTLPLPGPQADPVCGAFVELLRVLRESSAAQEAGEGAAQVIAIGNEPLGEIVETLRRVDAERYEIAIDMFSDLRTELVAATSDEEVDEIVTLLAGLDARYDQAAAPAIEHMSTTCPDVLAAR